MREPVARIFLCASALILLTAEAVAAEAGKGPSEPVFFLQIVVLLAVGRLLGEIMQRVGQPAVMGHLLAGIILGPSVLGAFLPGIERALFPPSPEQKAMLSGISQMGVLLLLLLTGMETDLRLVRKVGRASVVISLTGIGVPFLCGFVLGQLLPDHILPHPEMRLVTSLFLGTALSISSVKIVAMVVREMDFMRRNLGQIIVAAAIIEDTIGWIIIAIIFGLVMHGSIDPLSVGKSVIGTLLFLGVSLTLGRRVVAKVIRWTNDTFVSELPVITAILVIMGLMALLTDALGVHTVLGAFVAGMLVGQSPILTRHIDEQLRGLITALFMPVFFAVAGLSADLTVLADPALLMLTIGLIAIASVGKFGGAFLGGRMGGLSFREALAVGSGMNARGSTEVIVATVGLSLGALSQNLYTMIVAMAVLTTLAMPPLLRWALLRVPMKPAEQERLEREARDERGFLSSFERLLLAADDSPNGRLAAHLAGLIAGSRQIVTTVLEMVQAVPAAPRTRAVAAGDVVKSSAKSAQEAVADEERPEAVEVVTRKVDEGGKPASAAVEREAMHGYDVQMIGLAPDSDELGMVSERVGEVAEPFDGPQAIVAARGAHLDTPAPVTFDILLPIRATGHSQRAAELAIEVARTTRSPITALYVAESIPRRWSQSARLAIGLEEDAALKEIVALAEASGVQIRTKVHTGGDPAAAIVREARRGHRDLIVLGVSRRPAERLFFGKVATDVMRAAPCSLVLVSS